MQRLNDTPLGGWLVAGAAVAWVVGNIIGWFIGHLPGEPFNWRIILGPKVYAAWASSRRG